MSLIRQPKNFEVLDLHSAYFFPEKNPCQLFLSLSLIISYHVAACDEGPGMFAHFLTGISLLLVAAMLPFSLIFVVKVVQVINILFLF